MTIQLTDEDVLISEVSQKLDIKLENIYHITIMGGIEMMGELCVVEGEADSEELAEEFIQADLNEDLLFLFPIKIMKDQWIDQEGGYNCANYFIEWNSCIDGRYTYINPALIISKNVPNKGALTGYLKTLHDHYFQTEIYLDESVHFEKSLNNIEVEKSLTTDNIIHFSKYKK